MQVTTRITSLVKTHVVDILSKNGLYHYHSAEFLGNCWNSALVTNPYYNTTDFNGDKARHANGHSKILGVSFDGFPIYGPYGYTTANDATSAIKRIESSYRLRPDGYNPNRPTFTRTHGFIHSRL